MVSNITLDHSANGYDSSVGFSSGGRIIAASRWVNHRYELHGIGSDNNLYFKYINFYPNDTQSTYKVKAWKGDMQAYPTNSNSVMTQNISVSSTGYQLFEITNPVQLDVS